MILETLASIAAWCFIVAGAVGVVISGLGLIRLPDFYTRLHAGGITDTFGAELLIIGMAIHAGFTLLTVKLLIIGLFLFVTGPTATHAAANAALVAGLKPQLAGPPEGDVPDRSGDDAHPPASAASDEDRR